jgi:uncharacterized protein
MSKKLEMRRYQAELEQFCRRIEVAFQPDCIILHGSMARNTDTVASDIDIIVIADTLPQNFLERLYQLNRLRNGTAPIEAVGYTRAEWEKMIDHFHLTALEALHWGIPLRGDELFGQWRTKLSYWKTLGLQREAASWWVPPLLQQRLLQG